MRRFQHKTRPPSDDVDTLAPHVQPNIKRKQQGTPLKRKRDQAKCLIPFSIIGRRDWIRTNDPHHVKVVL